jgi:hypothetical protein
MELSLFGILIEAIWLAGICLINWHLFRPAAGATVLPDQRNRGVEGDDAAAQSFERAA